jgi:hypothetical protein
MSEFSREGGKSLYPGFDSPATARSEFFDPILDDGFAPDFQKVLVQTAENGYYSAVISLYPIAVLRAGEKYGVKSVSLLARKS